MDEVRPGEGSDFLMFQSIQWHMAEGHTLIVVSSEPENTLVGLADKALTAPL